MKQVKRLRVFAGPNGSGKTSMKGLIGGKCNLGIYVNADDVNRNIIENRQLSFADYSISVSYEDLKTYFSNSPFYLNKDNPLSKNIKLEQNALTLSKDYILDSYFSTAIADFIREERLKSNLKFSFETVMSHESKLDFVKRAKAKGYKTYLYFVALEDSIINIDRVRQRVKEGGHDVPKNKIIERYDRVLDLLPEAIRLFGKSYIFDNSSADIKHIASVEDNMLSIKRESSAVPAWFENCVLNKLKPEQ